MKPYSLAGAVAAAASTLSEGERASECKSWPQARLAACETAFMMGSVGHPSGSLV